MRWFRIQVRVGNNRWKYIGAACGPCTSKRVYAMRYTVDDAIAAYLDLMSQRRHNPGLRVRVV